MSAQNVYDVTGSPPQYHAERFAIVGGLEDTSTDEFDKYIGNINEVLGAFDDYQIDPEPALIVGGFHGEIAGKSASTVEADLREMFGYHKVIKPIFLRKVKPKKKAKPAKKNPKKKSKQTKQTKPKKKRGGDDMIDDYDNALVISNMGVDTPTTSAPRDISEDLF